MINSYAFRKLPADENSYSTGLLTVVSLQHEHAVSPACRFMPVSRNSKVEQYLIAKGLH